MKLGWNFHALHMRGRSRGIVVGKNIIDEVSKYLGEGRSTNGRCLFFLIKLVLTLGFLIYMYHLRIVCHSWKLLWDH
jgi:hypothetical protein